MNPIDRPTLTQGLTCLLLPLLLACSVDGAPAVWPSFRGPTGDGRAPGTEGKLPLTWSETENVSWKTAIPHKGWSTPVVHGNQIWLTTATEDGHDFYVLCLDAETGRIRFNKHLIHCDDPEPLGNNVNGYASPSAAIEAGRVYVHFGSYGTACLDTSTAEVLWMRKDLPCRHYRGPGSSVILYEDLLILTMDGVDQQYMCALDKRSGETVWRTDRTTDWKDLDENGQPKREGDFRKAFSTPLVVNVDGKEQLISPASSAVFAYDPRSGKERWKLQHEGFSTSVSPVTAKGLVLSTTGRGSAELLGIRPDGRGDVSGTHEAWRWSDRAVPVTPSPVTDGERVYTVGDSGKASCLDAATGKVLWSERVGGSYIASPLLSGDRLYLFSTQGKAVVLQAGDSFRQLAENRLDTGLMASPVAVDGALYLRSKTHLYRIEDAVPGL